MLRLILLNHRPSLFILLHHFFLRLSFSPPVLIYTCSVKSPLLFLLGTFLCLFSYYFVRETHSRTWMQEGRVLLGWLDEGLEPESSKGLVGG